MRVGLAGRGAVLLALVSILAACASLPDEAEQAVLRSFDPDGQPRIHFARQVDPLPEDLEAGAEEVWCVSVVFRCWSCPHGEWRTCISSYLVRRVNGAWEVAPVLTDSDWEGWEARGCPPEPDGMGRAPFLIAKATGGRATVRVAR